MPTMRAAVLIAPGTVRIEERPAPSPGPDEVVVAVERCGICGTDIHIFRGHYSADRLPLVPGHEFAGRIRAVGRDAGWLREGQRVVADINIGCGRCFHCQRNEAFSCTSIRQLGIHGDGAFAEDVVVPARMVIAVPDHVPADVAALTEPLSCVVRSARRSGLGLAESVLVIGAGPVGNLHVQLARLLGAGPVIVAETDPARAALAGRCGADVVVTDPAALADAVMAATGGRGVDLAIECVGRIPLYETALSLVRAGGRVAAFGLPGAEARLAVSPLQVILREQALVGSVAGMGRDMHDALALLALGRIDTAPFRAAVRPLEALAAAITEFATAGGPMKIQIDPAG